MARSEPWQIQLDSYPYSYQTDTRFQDLDIHGHVNNVAMAALLENSRARFYKDLTDILPDLGYRILIASININYLAECYFPQPVNIACGIEKVNNTSWNFAQAAFQLQGEGDSAKSVCVSTAKVVSVLSGENGSTPVPDNIREMLLQDCVRMDDPG